MQHSLVDLEIHAKTIQENLRRDAERARLLDAAERSGPWQVIPSALAHCVLASVRSWLSGDRAPQRQTGAPGTAEPAAPAVPRHAPARAAEPYAAMLVIARASARPIAEQPSRVGDG